MTHPPLFCCVTATQKDLPRKFQIKAYRKVVACTTLVAHSIISTVGMIASIEWLGFDESSIIGYPCTMRREVQGMPAVQQGWREVDVVNLLPMSFVAVAAAECVGDACESAILRKWP